MDKTRATTIQKRLENERTTVRAKIRTAATVSQRIRADEHDSGDAVARFHLDYDSADDVLFGQLGDRCPAVTEDAGSGLFLRTDPHDYRPIGFEVLDFKHTIGRRDSILKLFPEARSILEGGSTVVESTLRDLQQRLAQLVPSNWSVGREAAISQVE
jgi:hypothetical protein